MTIYALYLTSAFFIGNEHSCDGGGNFYFILGALSLPVLIASPFVLRRGQRKLVCFAAGIGSAFLGVIIWAWAFDASGMYFMCRLF